ncbi:Methylated-DNA--protein-cysteine methyltransferase, constitutive [Rubripirellula tenax]|uniref:Methylated-DNA--protein-cysteine methyltransferase n=1 Tax=Rubripirellula tenax TaxID=2528015 RepID=A0A5C6F1J6_9BACT|nr:methylated-DNA--[protein]-cysteine S-methyltransferase [Rubripirellula tenax]TWU54464.1 Methylated-DNA--protein-cysteine methyltransferase, constitutive [Rubripirellula tenax]
MNHFYSRFRSPVGELTLVARDNDLVGILWEDEDLCRTRLQPSIPADDHPVLIQTANELMEYFAGERTAFDIPISMTGTPFQLSVWESLRAIPYGHTKSYLAIAQSIGNPKAVRAVGGANRRNPISIVVPCHRVIGSSGKLTGFAGGLSAKERLLDLEMAGAAPLRMFSPNL